MIIYLNIFLAAVFVLCFVAMMVLIVLTHEPKPEIPDDPRLPETPTINLPICPHCGAIFHGAQHFLHGIPAAGTFRCPECFRVVTYDEAFNGLPES